MSNSELKSSYCLRFIFDNHKCFSPWVFRWSTTGPRKIYHIQRVLIAISPQLTARHRTARHEGRDVTHTHAKTFTFIIPIAPEATTLHFTETQRLASLFEYVGFVVVIGIQRTAGTSEWLPQILCASRLLSVLAFTIISASPWKSQRTAQIWVLMKRSN